MRMTMRKILLENDAGGDVDYLVKHQLFPTDTIDWDDDVWELIESSGANGGHKIYEGAGYRLVLSQAEPQLFEI